MFITIPKPLILNPAITGNDLLTYAGMFILEYKHTDFQTVYNVAGELYNNPLRKTKEIKKSMKLLSSLLDIISYEDKAYKSHLIIKHTDTFITINADDIYTLVNSDFSYHVNMFWLYCLILANTDPSISYKASIMPYGYFADRLQTADSTISSYMHGLEKLELIYIFHPTSLQHSPNIISKYANKDFVDMWVEQHGYISEKNAANRRRSLMAKFNYLVKLLEEGKPCPYSSAEVDEIRNCVIEHNRFCQIQAKIDKSYLEKIKDFALLDNISYT